MRRRLDLSHPWSDGVAVCGQEFAASANGSTTAGRVVGLLWRKHPSDGAESMPLQGSGLITLLIGLLFLAIPGFKPRPSTNWFPQSCEGQFNCCDGR